LEPEADPAASIEAEVDEAIAICSGDASAALRAMLVQTPYLEAEIEAIDRSNLNRLRPRSDSQVLYEI
jgi:hypothetical protein